MSRSKEDRGPTMPDEPNPIPPRKPPTGYIVCLSRLLAIADELERLALLADAVGLLEETGASYTAGPSKSYLIADRVGQPPRELKLEIGARAAEMKAEAAAIMTALPRPRDICIPLDGGNLRFEFTGSVRPRADAACSPFGLPYSLLLHRF